MNLYKDIRNKDLPKYQVGRGSTNHKDIRPLNDFLFFQQFRVSEFECF